MTKLEYDMLVAIAKALLQLMNQQHGRAYVKGYVEEDFKTAQFQLEYLLNKLG